MPLDYYYLIDYMKELRAYFRKEYKSVYKLSNIYQGDPDYSYFSVKTEALSKHKLKYVVVLNHKVLNFSICLSGQNKSIRKRYWNILRESSRDNYRVVESIDNSLSIIEHVIVASPDFSNRKKLSQLIEKEGLKFMNEIDKVLVNSRT